MESKFRGRDVISKPACPFCGIYIKKPKELLNGTPQEMPVGACECGAVYACDVTGHNLGTAMSESLLFACNWDWDLAWDLLPEEDYFVGEVEDYDYESHMIVHSGAYEGRNVTGVLYFIKLHNDVLEVTEEGFRRKLGKKSFHPKAKSGDRNLPGRKLTKKEVENIVADYDMDEIMNAARQDKKIIRYLQRLLYSADDLTRFRAADALGKASSVIADYDPAIVSKLLKNLFIAIADTASSSWGAIPAIGEIISNSIKQYASYAPQLYPMISDREILPEVLKALARITEVEPEPFGKIKYKILTFLKDVNPEVRAYSIIIIGNLKAAEADSDLTDLTQDNTELKIYEKGHIIKKSIKELAGSAMEKINSQ